MLSFFKNNLSLLIVVLQILIWKIFSWDYQDEFYEQVARIKSCFPEDKCADNMLHYRFKSPAEMSLAEFNNSNCFCDRDCSKYNDCCIGALNEDDKFNYGFVCEELPGNFKPLTVFMVTKCLDGDYGFLLEKCEQRTIRSNSDMLRLLPVFSTRTNITYRNIYCAFCNNEIDISIEIWPLILSCNNKLEPFHLENVKQFIRKGEYNAISNIWSYSSLSCSVHMDIPQKRQPVIRKCKIHVKECAPDWNNDTVRDMCKRYTAYLYDIQPLSNCLNVIYKNPHCALCNYVNVKLLQCENRTETCFEQGPQFERYSYYRYTYEFELDFDKKTQERNCSDNYFFNPFSRACELVYCNKRYNYGEKGCLPKPDNTSKEFRNMSHETDCYKITINPGEYLLFENESLFVNETKKLYSPKDYQKIGASYTICDPVYHDIFFKFDIIQSYVCLISFCISLGTLFLFLLIYLVLPKLWNLPGKSLMSLAAAIFLSQILFLISLHFPDNKEICRASAVFLHFSFLASSFWMNVLSIDICRTFSSSQYHVITDRRSKTFLRYSCYAWLTPLLIVGLALIIDVAYIRNEYRPQYGKPVCWITQRKALLVFFALPLALLLLENIVFFILTARSINSSNLTTKFVMKISDKIRFALYIALATIMGLSWIFAFIAALAGVSVLWYLFILLYALHGLFILVAFSCKRKVVELIKERLSGNATRQKSRSGGYSLANTKSSTTNLRSNAHIQFQESTH